MKKDEFKNSGISEPLLSTEVSDQPVQESKDNKILAIIAINLHALSKVTLSTLQKLLNQNEGVRVADWAFVCRSVTLVLGVLTMYFAGVKFPDQKREIFWLLVRGFLAIVCLVFFFLSVSLNTISLHTIINETAPFWILLLGFIFLRESITPLQVVAMIVCFSCVMVIALNSSSEEDQIEKTTTLAGVTVAVLTAISFALIYIMNRQLRETHVFTVILFNGFVGVLTALVGLAWQFFTDRENNPTFFGQYSAGTYLALIGMGALEFVASSLLIVANQNAKSAFVAIFCYVTVFFAFVADFFVFGRVIQGWDLASALTILGVTVGMAFFNCRQEILKK